MSYHCMVQQVLISPRLIARVVWELCPQTRLTASASTDASFNQCHLSRNQQNQISLSERVTPSVRLPVHGPHRAIKETRLLIESTVSYL